MRLVRILSTTVLLAATTMLYAEDVVVQADFAPGSETNLSQGTDFTVRLTLSREAGEANPGLTAYDIKMQYDPTAFEVTGYTPLVDYLPTQYTVAVPAPGVDSPDMDNGMAYFHFTAADLAGTSTPANGELERALFEVHMTTITAPQYPLDISFMQNNRMNRDQGPTVAFGAGALSLPDSVTFDLSALGQPEPTPTPVITPTFTPTPTVVPPNPDSDRDGLTDDEEATLGTDPTKKDTDGDGIEDGVEVATGTDPLDINDPASYEDVDDDGVPDQFDPDTTTKDADGDGIVDMWEIVEGFDPDDPESVPPIGDADMNGSKNFIDAVAIFNIFLGNFDPNDYAEASILDVNRDGNVDTVDGVIMFNWYLGNLPYLPFGV